MPLTGTKLGFLVGSVPTIAMIFFSIIFSNLSISKTTTALFQNFAAGLILAAVAAELFPLMLEDVKKSDTWGGVTIGFAVGLVLVYGLEPVIEYFESDEAEEKPPIQASCVESPIANYVKSSQNIEKNPDEDVDNLELVLMENDFEEEGIAMSAVLIKLPEHKNHLLDHLLELKQKVDMIEEKCNRLTAEKLTVNETEELAEKIDEDTHSLQYLIDHCRRLLHGSETGPDAGRFNKIDDEKKIEIKRSLANLKSTTDHLIEHMKEGSIDSETVREINVHLAQMDRFIISFHNTVEDSASKWVRRNREMTETEIGDKVPISLVVPVTVDCFVDGFLIGVSCALSSKAGIILGFANMLEMGFLGIAYSCRIVKCTGSSAATRALVTYLPPLLMFLAAGLGAFVASASEAYPVIFVAFVAFGVVALVALVCTELLIEASHSFGEDPPWYSTLPIYAAIYLVLMIFNVIG